MGRIQFKKIKSFNKLVLYFIIHPRRITIDPLRKIIKATQGVWKWIPLNFPLQGQIVKSRHNKQNLLTLLIDVTPPTNNQRSDKEQFWAALYSDDWPPRRAARQSLT